MPRGLLLFVCLLVASTLLSIAAPASAQVSEHSHRLIKLYDFEDTDDRGNKIGFAGSLMPRHWFVIGRPAKGVGVKFNNPVNNRLLQELKGYPSYASVMFDRKEKASGDFSLRLGLSGGRTGAYVQHGAISITSGSNYQVAVKVKTRDLDFAWAEVHAYFLDNAGKKITESLQRSDPIVTRGQWEHVSVKLPGEYERAAFIGIELHILQPAMDPDHLLGEHQIVPEDISGAAWFDDVAVWELPSVSVTTDQLTNIITTKEPPTLHAKVRDLTGQRLRAVIEVYDHGYNLIDRVEDKIDRAGWSWTPELQGRYGWYWADLSVYESGSSGQLKTQVARTLTGFLWLPPGQRQPGEDRGRFVLVAEDAPTAHLPLIADVLEQSKLTGLVVSGWESAATPRSTAARARVLEPMIRDLLIRRGNVSVSFWPVPVELAGRAGADTRDPLNVLSKPGEQWLDYAKPFLAPLGQRTNRWQVGTSTLPNAFLAREFTEDLLAARVGIRAIAPSPNLILPWRLDQPPRTEEAPPGTTYAVAWPQGVTPEMLAGALKDWPQPPSNIRLDIELADAEDMTHERRVADLMIRTLHAWEVEPGAIGLNKPWTETFERQTSLTPDPVLGSWIHLSQQLGGQRVIGRMPLAPGLVAMILDGRQGGMLAVWNERAESEPVDLTLYLGDYPVAVDPYGNATPLPSSNGKHVLTVTQTPTIIRGINPRLAMMRGSFVLDDPFIETLQVGHQRTLKIHNPWPRTMNGHYTITQPKNWIVQPQRRHISIAPGATAEVPVVLRFPINEDGGYKPLTADFVFNVGEDYNVTLTTPMTLGLRDVDFEADVIIEPGKQPGTYDAVATLSIKNTGQQRKTLNIFAGLAGHMRQERILPGIAPGEFASRTIRFRDVGEQMGKSPIRCGVREANGPAVLNQTLEMIPPRRRAEPPPVAEVDVP